MKEETITQSNYKNLPFLSKSLQRIKNGDIIVKPALKSSKMPRFSDVVPFLYQLLDQEEFFGVWLKRIPFCVLSPNAHDHILKIDRKKRGEKKKECSKCKFFNECFGFPLGYFKKYGAKEVKPILDIPEEVMIEIEPKCNFKCQFCFNKISFAKKGRNINRLSLDYVKRIIDSVKKAKIKMVRFTGGEPLLYPGIIELMRYAKNKNIEVRLNTNGSLIDSKMAKKFKGIVDNILIPIESWSNAKEDKITGFRNALKKKIEAVKFLKNAHIPVVRIGTVATRDNIKNFQKIYDLVRSLPVDEWELYRPVMADSELARSDIEKLVAKIIQVRKKTSVPISLANAIPFCAVRNKNKINSISSGALYDEGHRRLVVDARGFVKPHYFINKNVGDPLDILSAWNHPFMRKMRQLKFVPRECKKCLFVFKCRGGSRFLAYSRSGKYNSRDPLAKL